MTARTAVKLRMERKEPREHVPGDTSVCVGQKGVMSYVLAVVTQFNSGAPSVCVKARGKLISRAVDVAEITRNRFLPSVKPKDIRIGMEEMKCEDGHVAKVSFIEITLAKELK